MQSSEIILISICAAQSVGLLVLPLYYRGVIKKNISDAHQKALSAEEAAIKKMAAELHDNLAPSLLLTKLQLEKYITTNKSNQLTACARRIATTLEQLRELVNLLHPSAVSHLGLVKATRDLLLVLEQNTNIKTSFSVDTSLVGLEQETEISIFRIIQESVQNSLRHAQPSEIGISMYDRDNHVCVDIQDNGIGFLPEKIRQGHGMASIKQRAHTINGQLIVESTSGKGTHIHLKIPK